MAWFAHEVGRLPIDLRLGRAADVADLSGFDEVIVATGVSPRDPKIPGQDSAKGKFEVLRGSRGGTLGVTLSVRRVAFANVGGGAATSPVPAIFLVEFSACHSS